MDVERATSEISALKIDPAPNEATANNTSAHGKDFPVNVSNFLRQEFRLEALIVTIYSFLSSSGVTTEYEWFTVRFSPSVCAFISAVGKDPAVSKSCGFKYISFGNTEP